MFFLCFTGLLKGTGSLQAVHMCWTMVSAHCGMHSVSCQIWSRSSFPPGRGHLPPCSGEPMERPCTAADPRTDLALITDRTSSDPFQKIGSVFGPAV
ncbi:hypothetical protein AALO_G00062170 [Alosa alosa]|uniref:Secreted protein n=1 Tax=Alosa alosa TaxID=278164 RepID=A0AAV6H3N1_9TELE|nr:hypothetical protein AALO_G00062170 [Alosa alosa]